MCNDDDAMHAMQLIQRHKKAHGPHLRTSGGAKCVDDALFKDEFDYPCVAWLGYSCTVGDTAFESLTKLGQNMLLQMCPKSCKVCTDTAQAPPQEVEVPCEDNPTYVDKLGSPCVEWTTYDCHKAEEFGR